MRDGEKTLSITVLASVALPVLPCNTDSQCDPSEKDRPFRHVKGRAMCLFENCVAA